MSEPLIFITEHTVKPGRLKALERLSEEFVEFGEANEPRLLAIRAYLDDEGDRFTLVQLHPDAESMDFRAKSPETRSTRRSMWSTTTASTFSALPAKSHAVSSMRSAPPACA